MHFPHHSVGRVVVSHLVQADMHPDVHTESQSELSFSHNTWPIVN